MAAASVSVRPALGHDRHIVEREPGDQGGRQRHDAHQAGECRSPHSGADRQRWLRHEGLRGHSRDPVGDLADRGRSVHHGEPADRRHRQHDEDGGHDQRRAPTDGFDQRGEDQRAQGHEAGRDRHRDGERRPRRAWNHSAIEVSPISEKRPLAQHADAHERHPEHEEVLCRADERDGEGERDADNGGGVAHAAPVDPDRPMAAGPRIRATWRRGRHRRGGPTDPRSSIMIDERRHPDRLPGRGERQDQGRPPEDAPARKAVGGTGASSQSGRRSGPFRPGEPRVVPIGPATGWLFEPTRRRARHRRSPTSTAPFRGERTGD